MTNEERIYYIESLEYLKEHRKKYAGEVEALDAAIEELKHPRPIGKWIEYEMGRFKCSNCGYEFMADDTDEENFCCWCGSFNKPEMKCMED